MSLTSCYGYVVELAESSLTGLLRSVIAQGETTGLPTTYTEVRDFDGFNVEVTASLVDTDERASSFEITAVNLQVILHLHMDISVTLLDQVGVDPLSLEVAFQLPGHVAKDESVDPTMLQIEFGSLTPDDLNVQLGDMGLVFNATLFEQPIHEMFLAHPNFDATDQAWKISQANVAFGPQSYFVWVWFYDDDPMSSTSRGNIWVDPVEVDSITVNMPGRLHALNVSAVIVYDISFVLEFDVGLQRNALPGGGEEIEVLLDAITASDVRVTNVVFNAGGPLPPIETVLGVFMGPKVVEALADIDNPKQAVPTETTIVAGIEAGLLNFAAGLTFPIMPLAEAGSGSLLDLSTSVPKTVGSSLLALQVEPLGDSTPCDDVDDFLGGSEFAVAVSEPRVRALLDDVEEALEGSNVDFAGYDVTMNRPSATLADAGAHGVDVGHIWVTGSVVVHVGGCVGDVNATYQGSLTLSPINKPDGTLDFDVIPGEFAGDTDAKDKKDDFDPNAIRDLVGDMEFPFPDVPRTFEGVGRIDVQYTTAVISAQGIVIAGGVTIQLLNTMMLSGVLETSGFWAMDSARGR